MSQNEAVEGAKSPEDLRTRFRIEKERINWIDQGRGFVMFMLVVSGLLPSAWRHIPGLDFFLEHPSGSTTAQYMNLYDVGVPAFFVIIGLLMAVSFKKRVQSKGVSNAVLNEVFRWGLIFAVGLLFIIIPGALEGDDPEIWFGEVKEIATGVSVFVVRWDVVISLGFVGLASIPFFFLNTKWRLIISYAMMAFYQVMVFIPETYWRAYAISSVHGGIIGSIFVLVPIVLVSSVVGEFFVLDKETPVAEKNKKFAMLGIANLLVGIVLWLVPGGFPNKRQSTMGWATISLAVCIGVVFLLIWLDYKDEEYPKLHPVNKARIVLFKSYGMNPFLIYAVAEIAMVLWEALVGDSFDEQLIAWLIFVPAITIMALVLYKQNKAISTTKVALGVIVIVAVLAVILLPLL